MSSSTTFPDPGRDWVALPWARSPRWFLPRAPAAKAKASLSVYHPVTYRSRVGWEAARALAGRGLFGLVPGTPLVPREVWSAAGPLMPSGGAMAVARANHPGRFLALVFDARTRPIAFVKIARDTPGARSLDCEEEALRRYGPLVPSPLSTPAVMDRSEGVLVLQPVEWRPRARPWHLPREVAHALGEFFRNTASATPGGVGAAHGDFAPWNLLRTQEGWAVVDWENFRVAAPPFFDLFHFIVQSNSELRRPLKRSILRGLRLEGWVGRAIRAYADGAGIDAGDGPRYLREYLKTSAATLELQAPRRGVRVRSKLAARLAFEHPTK